MATIKPYFVNIDPLIGKKEEEIKEDIKNYKRYIDNYKSACEIPKSFEDTYGYSISYCENGVIECKINL